MKAVILPPGAKESELPIRRKPGGSRARGSVDNFWVLGSQGFGILKRALQLIKGFEFRV